MTGPAPSDGPLEIPGEIEDAILQILDSTEPGPQRDAALAALAIPPEYRAAVDDWLAEDGLEETFLASPPSTSTTATGAGTLPRRLGDYELESVLGKGGMGIVYRARDLRLGREVALKVLPERFADHPKRLQRFEREVRAVAALRHPNIVPVYVADRIDGVPYYTMELVSGRSLDKVIAALAATGRPVEKLRLRDWQAATGETGRDSSTDSVERTLLGTVCQLVIQIADALQHAHDNGVTHRDVKPSNILAEGGSRAKLFDFGLARLDDDLEMTRSSELIGSPHYMSPEQIQSRDIDHRTDIYSLGVTLYELLTLKVPFEVSSPQQVYQMILHREPRRPTAIHPNLPKDLETICLTAMEKDPDRRFATAGGFADDLRRFLRFEPIQARPIGSVTRSLRWMRRNRTPVSLVLLVCIALLAIYITNRSGAKKIEAAESERDSIQNELDDLKEKRRTAAIELERITRQAADTRSDLAGKSAELAEVARTLAAKNTEIAEQRRQQQALSRNNRELDTRNQKLQQDAARRQQDLDRLVAARDQLRTERGQLERQIEGQRQLLAKAEADLHRAERDLGTLRESHRITTINKLLMEARTLRDSDTGLGLILATEAAALADATTAADPELQVRVDNTLLELLRATQERRTFTRHEHPLTAIDFAPSGALVASASNDGVVYLWRRETGQSVARCRLPAAVAHLEFVRDDRLLLALSNGDVLAWNGHGDSPPERLVNALHQPQTRSHAAPGGAWVVSHIDSRPSQLIVHRDGATQPDRNLGHVDNPIVDFEFDPRGDLVLAITTSRSLEIWNAGTGQLERSIAGSAPLLSATYDAQGRRIATLDVTGVVRVLDAADASVLLERPVDAGRPLGVGRIAFCADDRRLLVSATGLQHHLFVDPRNGNVVGRVAVNDAALGFRLDRKRDLACVAHPAGGFDLINTRNGLVVTHLAGRSASAARRYRPVTAFDPDGSALATVFGETQARIWRTGPGGALRTVGPGLSNDPIDGGAEMLHFGRFEPGQGRVLTASNLGLSSWHLGSGRRSFLDHDARRPLLPAAIAADGRGVTYAEGQVRILLSGPRPTVRDLLAIAPTDLDQVLTWPGGRFGLVTAATADTDRRELRILDASGRTSARLPLPNGRHGGGTPQPDPGGTGYLIGYDELSFVAIDRPERRVPLPFSRRPAAFSPDGRWVATSTGFGAKVWTARSGATWCELGGLPDDYSQITAIRFLPDGRRVATGWSDGVVRVHDCSQRAARKVLEVVAHADRVQSLAFDAGGRLLLSTSLDGTARIRDLAAPDRPPLSFAPGEPCLHAEFRADDAEVLVVCPRRVHTFPLDLRARARAACPRQLSAAERARFGLADQRR